VTDERQIDIGTTRYLQVFIKRKSVIFLTVAGALFVGLIYILLSSTVYEARSQLLLERSGPKVLSIEEVYSIDSTQKDHCRTQCEIIQSRTLLNQVVDRLNLKSVPPFLNAKDPVATLSGMIKVFPIRNSPLISVSVFGADPDEITRINHAIIDIFVQQQLEDKLGVSKNAANWLSRQIGPLRKALEEAEDRSRRFLEEEGISSVKEASSLVNQKISSVNKSLIEARKNRMSIESDYVSLQESVAAGGEDIYTYPLVARDGLIKELTREKINLEREYTTRLRIYQPTHPEMQRIREEIKFIEDKMAKQAGNISEITKLDYLAEKEQENSLQELINSLNLEATRLNKLKISFNILERDVESSRELYEAVVDRLKETDVIDELTSSGVRVVDRAEIPMIPVKPKKKMILILSAAIGLLAGLVLSIYIENSNTSFRTAEEASSFLQLPVLGKIPYLRDKHKDIVALDWISYNEPRSAISETFRHLRTALESISPEEGGTSVLITSAIAQEGKTDIIINLASSLAAAGRNVLLLEADMRRPRFHNTFNLATSPGLNELLEGRASLDEVLRAPGITNLSIIPCGNIPPHPSELLQSGTLEDAVAQMKKRYDYVLIDSPPVDPVTDALILADAVDEVVLVVQCERTKREIVLETKNRLDKCKSRLLGLVMAQIRIHSSYYNNYY